MDILVSMQELKESKSVVLRYLALVLVLEVVEAVAALPLAPGLEVGQEVVIGGIASPHLLHGDELLVLDEEDAVAVPENRVSQNVHFL